MVMKNWVWLKSYFSPFKAPKIKFYFGEVAVGTPYFFPRKWVKSKDKPGYSTPVPKKIGFDFVPMGWKTKFDQYRHEWNPLWSFVFFKWQVAVFFIPDHSTHYWESWLYYERDTDKNTPKVDRIIECITKAPQIWRSYSNGKEETINYYSKILKKKYLDLIPKHLIE